MKVLAIIGAAVVVVIVVVVVVVAGGGSGNSPTATVNGFIHAAAVELGKYNITVNGVEPGTIVTDTMKEVLGAEEQRKIARMMPLGRIGNPEDVAYAMLFLASDEASYITGQTIVVDGGAILPEFKL